MSTDYSNTDPTSFQQIYKKGDKVEVTTTQRGRTSTFRGKVSGFDEDLNNRVSVTVDKYFNPATESWDNVGGRASITIDDPEDIRLIKPEQVKTRDAGSSATNAEVKMSRRFSFKESKIGSLLLLRTQKGWIYCKETAANVGEVIVDTGKGVKETISKKDWSHKLRFTPKIFSNRKFELGIHRRAPEPTPLPKMENEQKKKTRTKGARSPVNTNLPPKEEAKTTGSIAIDYLNSHVDKNEKLNSIMTAINKKNPNLLEQYAEAAKEKNEEEMSNLEDAIIDILQGEDVYTPSKLDDLLLRIEDSAKYT